MARRGPRAWDRHQKKRLQTVDYDIEYLSRSHQLNYHDWPRSDWPARPSDSYAVGRKLATGYREDNVELSPLFKKENWPTTSAEEYNLIRPALALATRFLNHPWHGNFFYAVALKTLDLRRPEDGRWGDLFQRKKNSSEPVIQSLSCHIEKLEPLQRLMLDTIIRDLSSIVTFEWKDLDEHRAATVPSEDYKKYVIQLDVRLMNSIKEDRVPWWLGICQWALTTDLGLLMCHQLAHLLYLNREKDNVALYGEPVFNNDPFIELGCSFTKFSINGPDVYSRKLEDDPDMIYVIVESQLRDHPGFSNVYKTLEPHIRNYTTTYLVPLPYLLDLQDGVWWERAGNHSPLSAFAVPKIIGLRGQTAATKRFNKYMGDAGSSDEYSSDDLGIVWRTIQETDDPLLPGRRPKAKETENPQIRIQHEVNFGIKDWRTGRIDRKTEALFNPLKDRPGWTVHNYRDENDVSSSEEDEDEEDSASDMDVDEPERPNNTPDNLDDLPDYPVSDEEN